MAKHKPKKRGPSAKPKKRKVQDTPLCAFPDKKQYWSLSEGERALLIMQFKGLAGLDVHVYRCPEPGANHHHIGHSRHLADLLRKLEAEDAISAA